MECNRCGCKGLSFTLTVTLIVLAAFSSQLSSARGQSAQVTPQSSASSEAERALNALRLEAARGNTEAQLVVAMRSFRTNSPSDYGDAMFKFDDLARRGHAARIFAFAMTLPAGYQTNQLMDLLSRSGYAPATMYLAERQAQMAMEQFNMRNYPAGNSEFNKALRLFATARQQGGQDIQQRVDEMERDLRRAESTEIRAEDVLAFIAGAVAVLAITNANARPSAPIIQPSGFDPCASINLMARMDSSYVGPAAIAGCWRGY